MLWLCDTPGIKSPWYCKKPAESLFHQLADGLGLNLKEEKNEQGKLVNFRGVLIDTTRMVIWLLLEKKVKGLRQIKKYNSTALISWFDSQQLVGFLISLRLLSRSDRPSYTVFETQNSSSRKKAISPTASDLRHAITWSGGRNFWLSTLRWNRYFSWEPGSNSPCGLMPQDLKALLDIKCLVAVKNISAKEHTWHRFSCYLSWAKLAGQKWGSRWLSIAPFLSYFRVVNFPGPIPRLITF